MRQARRRRIAFRVATADVPETLTHLCDQELITRVYKPGLHLPCLLPARTVQACCLVVDCAHQQYCGRLSPEETVACMCQGHGRNDPNCEFLFNTVAHFDDLGIADSPLQEMAKRVREVHGIGPHCANRNRRHDDKSAGQWC